MEAGAIEGVNFQAAWGVGDEVWAVGAMYDFDSAVVVHFDGKSWEALSTLTSYGLLFPIRSLWATSPDDVWLAAGTLAHWSGSRWRTTTPLGEDLQFAHIWAPSADDMWAIVEMGSEVRAQLTRSQGSDWIIVPNVPLDALTHGCSNETDDVWIAGSALGDTDPPMYFASVIQWDGTSWTSRPGIPGYDVSIVQLFCTGDSAVAITGGGDHALISWDGQDWQQAQQDEGLKGYTALWASDSGVGWVAGHIGGGVVDDAWMPQIWRLEAGALTPTVDPDVGLPGYPAAPDFGPGAGVRAIWETSSGRAFAFGAGGIVHEYVGP